MRSAQTRPATRAAGFTMMEAMIALVLMMIGILGMGALAGATVRSNMQAQDRTAATYLADKMLGTLQIEALGWNNGSWAPTQDVPVAATHMPFLSKLPPGVTAGTTGFQEMTQQLGAIQAFTYDLRPVAPNVDGAKFCVHYALTWLQANETIRADVRVYWMRRGADPDPFNFYSSCGSGDAVEMAKNVNDLHCVARTAILQRNVNGGQQ